MLGFILPVLAITCPDTSCTDLEVGVCATKSNSSIQLNKYGCPKGKCCFVTELQSWYNGETQHLNCSEMEQEEEESVECPSAPSSQMLQEGLHPKRCESSEDCLAETGQKSDCVCGLDGFGYCKPLWGSEVFARYWEVCRENSQVSYQFWKYYQDLYNYYPEFVAAPVCSLRIFQEFQSLQEEPEFSVLLELSLLSALLI